MFMVIGRAARTAALLTTAAGLSGCTLYDGYGYGPGYSDGYYTDYTYPPECYDKEGYLYPECEDAAYIARNSYGYGGSWYNSYGPYGWYDGFYYPGYSIYIYDRQGHRHRWSDNHRRHWEGRRHARRNRDGDRRHEDGRREDRRRDGDRRAIAPDANPRGVRGQMRGFRDNGAQARPNTGSNTGRQATVPQRAPQPGATPPPPPPPPPPPARTNDSNRQPASNRTRQTQRLRQNPSSDPR
jgi:hypothetical protein